MNKNFYNSTHTIICKEDLDIELNKKFKFFKGTLEECLYNIKKHELNKDEFFSGHIIVNKPSAIEKNIKYFEKLVNKYSFDTREVFVSKVFHHGIDSKCSVSDDIILCSSWVLPIVCNFKRSNNNNLYKDFMRHRIQMKPIAQKDIL